MNEKSNQVSGTRPVRPFSVCLSSIVDDALWHAPEKAHRSCQHSTRDGKSPRGRAIGLMVGESGHRGTHMLLSPVRRAVLDR